jgi:two-component system LytT family response regulator
MNLIKAVIVDDEKHGIVTLHHLLTQYCKEVEVVATCQKSTEAKSIIEETRPDIVFMDIEMPVLSGFDVLAQFSNLSFQTIFTTAYDQYAIAALRLSALDYLLKPVDRDELKAAIDKFLLRESASTKKQVQMAKHFTQSGVMDTLAISSSKGLHFVKIKEIIYLEATSCYTNIVMTDGQVHLVSKTLSSFEEALNEHPFFRAHKSFIINLDFIKHYIRGEGGEVIMMNNASINLSRTKKQEFLNFFTKI